METDRYGPVKADRDPFVTLTVALAAMETDRYGPVKVEGDWPDTATPDGAAMETDRYGPVKAKIAPGWAASRSAPQWRPTATGR
ncbi:hypothetical protein [Salinispora cortesiana]|uniref:hypothetical protein n=1 Tax=Salinispora cortesiana TaxID=1305843 RepID=UPI0004149993